MTKSEYRKELYAKFIDTLKADIEEYEKKELKARDMFERGKWVGKRQEAERILKMFM